MATDPYRAYNFGLQIDGISRGGFLEAEGLGATIEVIPYREAGATAGMRNLVGQVTNAPLLLRYGVTADPALWHWFKKVASGQPVNPGAKWVSEPVE